MAVDRIRQWLSSLRSPNGGRMTRSQRKRLAEFTGANNPTIPFNGDSPTLRSSGRASRRDVLLIQQAGLSDELAQLTQTYGRDEAIRRLSAVARAKLNPPQG